MQPTVAVSSANFSTWQSSEVYLKSDVHRVNRTGDSTVLCRARVLLVTISEQTTAEGQERGGSLASGDVAAAIPV